MIISLSGSYPYSMVLARLMDSMGTATWLTNLELRSGGDKAGSRLKIIGLTAANNELGDFLDQLAKEPIFDDVLLKYAGTGRNTANSPAGTDEIPVQFEIECDVLGSERT